MIVRVWKGWTTPENAPVYQALFCNEIAPKLTKDIKGYISTRLLKIERNNEVEFTTHFYFDSIDSIKHFAGDDYTRAVIPDEAKAVLTRYNSHAEHHQVIV